jgi:Fur family ferric uptake transcriptional regulator
MRDMDRTRAMARELARQGLRLTPQRMILSEIEASESHISAEEIHRRIAERYPNVNISTVYRTLEMLHRLGLVTETDLGEGRVRYHPAEKGHHHHLVCESCGSIIDLDDALLDPLKRELQRRYSFAAELKHLAILGRCAKCTK